MKLAMGPGFDWRKVAWGRPDSPPRPFCSYCSAYLPEDSVPLIMARGDGTTARFCDLCVETWVTSK